MFNSKWVNGKDVNGQSFENQYVTAEANWSVKATVSLNASSSLGASTQWKVRATLSDASVLTSTVFAEADWKAVSTTHFTSYRQISVSCEWVGLSNASFIGGGVISLISAPLHRCFKVGPYKAQFYVGPRTNQFYVDDLYRNQAA
jgi:hypothetical protein